MPLLMCFLNVLVFNTADTVAIRTAITRYCGIAWGWVAVKEQAVTVVTNDRTAPV